MKRAAILWMAVFLVSCTAGETRAPGEKHIVLRSRERSVPFIVEIADAPDEHARGLMGRTHLPRGRGMLFLFPHEQVLSFWMKNTLIPLDIFYFDARGQIVSATTMEPCKADPCPSYSSEGAAQFALEVAAGFLDTNGEEWELILP